MPQRVELTELTSGYIGGVPFAVAIARDRRLVGFAGTIDGDGFMDEMEDVMGAARTYLRRLDKKAQRAEDAGG
jgi:hypothetical protein